jgi:hypothetical protein
MRHLRWASAASFVSIAAIAHCGGRTGAALDGGPSTSPDAGYDTAAPGSDSAVARDAALVASPVIIAAGSTQMTTASLSVNYWTWPDAFGNSVAGTESLVAALHPRVLRVGGYNNDANTPDGFGPSQIDAMVAYAQAIGASPLLQVPLLADTTGQPPTAAEAAAMVTYVNGTRGYKIPFFSIGNEPDLYATQGLPTDMTKPAIPGYTPAQYCATALAYAPQMRAAAMAADPTTNITIFGPDLSYQYRPPNDWLTPILQGCGDLFDVVSIHRYPFSSTMATVAAAARDASNFRQTIADVRSLMTAAGFGSKPLAVTEMNIAYDATTTVLDASPGTVPSALWLADIFGSALELGVWTSAVWNISDPDDWSLGLLGLPPAHTPRPEYYAYQLYADHFGPNMASVTAEPPNIAAHASRNVAQDTTDLIVANWNDAPVALAFEVTGLATSPSVPIYVLPALSMAAVEIPDQGAASAWIYGADQHQAGIGPQPLAPSAGTVGPIEDAGSGARPDAAAACTSIPPPSASITTAGRVNGSTLAFGPPGNSWSSFTFAGPGEPSPTAAVSSNGNGLAITAGFDPTVAQSGAYSGVGLFFSSPDCLDASSYTGIEFDFRGDLGGCSLSFGVGYSGDLSRNDDPNRGLCKGADNVCYGPSVPVAVLSGATIPLPFTELTGGTPHNSLDPSSVVSVQWELLGPGTGPDGGACSASFTVENVAFY